MKNIQEYLSIDEALNPSIGDTIKKLTKQYKGKAIVFVPYNYKNYSAEEMEEAEAELSNTSIISQNVDCGRLYVMDPSMYL